MKCLLTAEALVLLAGSERCVRSLVAHLQFGRLGDSVVVGTPHELDGVTDGGIDSERHVTEDALSRCDIDGVGSTGSRATHSSGRRGHVGTHGSVGSHAF